MIAKSVPIRRLAISYFFLELQFWFPVWMLFLTDRGFDLTTMVIADGVFRFTMVSLEFPMGILGDRIGRKKSYIFISILAVSTYIGISFINNYLMLFSTWILWGIFWAMSSGTTSAYTYELIIIENMQNSTVSIFGFMRAVSSIAALVSHLAAGFLFSLFPAMPFVMNGIFAFFALVIAFTLPEITNHPDSNLRRESQTFKQFLTLINKNSSFLAGSILLALSLVYFWSPRILMQPLFLELEISPQLVSTVYFSYSLAGVFAGLLAGQIKRLMGNKNAIVFGFLMLLFGIFLIALTPGLAVLYFFPMLSFGYYLAQTLLEVTLHHQLENRYRASFLSAISFFGGSIIILTRPGLGILADQNNVQFAFLVWAILGIGLLILFVNQILKL